MFVVAVLSLLAAAKAQKIGTNTAESHPRISWQQCSEGGNCRTVSGEAVIDANWRWIHNVGGFNNCYQGDSWTNACSSNDNCAQTCAVEGANYQATYGVTTNGDQLRLNFVTNNESGQNTGSRMYLMKDENTYQTFNLLGNEFAFDVDLTSVACGLNAALYFVAMEADGGKASYPVNEAGAKYGTGYCDSQCARDLKFIGGQANFEGWTPSPSDNQSGKGSLGSCCAEIDVWESNSHSYAVTPHACTNNKYHVCKDDTCGGTFSDDRYAGLCDADGCDFNPYRLGNTNFYGAGKALDTTKPFTVVTQFDENKTSQYFVQNGKRIEPPNPTYQGFPADNSLTPDFCTARPNVFGDRNRFSEVGGYAAVNDAYRTPMVLVMSIWADHYSNMLWLDSTYPPEKAGQPGSARGDCATDSGVPAQVIAQDPDAFVTWSNIRFGPIGSTTEV